MRAIDYIQEAYSNFALCHMFVEVERQILRERTVAQVSYQSDSLGLMIKLFVSEMENEGGIYIAPLGTDLGFRDAAGWVEPWKLITLPVANEIYDNTRLEDLRRTPFPKATFQIALQYELDWFVANQQALVKHFVKL